MTTKTNFEPAEASRLIPGKLYQRLYHGRHDPKADLTDWGLDGPTIGPLAYFIQTYGCFRYAIEPDGPDTSLVSVDDLIFHEGVYYGDFELSVSPSTTPTKE